MNYDFEFNEKGRLQPFVSLPEELLCRKCLNKAACDIVCVDFTGHPCGLFTMLESYLCNPITS